MKMTLVIFADDVEQVWCRIDKNDIVESFINNSLKIVNKGDVEKYNIKDEMNKNELGEDDLEEIKDNAEYAETYTEDYIRLDSLQQDVLYFDDYCDAFFTKNDIEDWETEQYYWYHDGQNWRMLEIQKIKEIEVEHIESENYNTGVVQTYKTKDGSVFKIDSSNYQGSVDNVLGEYSEIIENLVGGVK